MAEWGIGTARHCTAKIAFGVGVATLAMLSACGSDDDDAPEVPPLSPTATRDFASPPQVVSALESFEAEASVAQ